MNARALFLLPLFALAACGAKPEGGSTTSAPAVTAKPSATATTKPSAAPTASAAPSASAAPTASAAPSASASAEPEAEAEPTGAVHIHMETVKVTSGKNEGAERVLKRSMLKLRTTCVNPAIKIKPSFEGTLKVTLDVDAEGKITKATPKVATGKLPDELPKCFAKYYEEKVQLPGGKSTVEGTILLGPHVNQKK